MEEIIEIIEIILAGLTLVLVIIPFTRAKRAKGEQESIPEVQPPAESPETDLKEPLQRPRKGRRGSVPRLHPDSQEVIYRVEGEWSKEEAQKESNNSPLHKKEAAANGAKHPDMEDFSLRKAVIWSEILKPKFEEEN